MAIEPWIESLLAPTASWIGSVSSSAVNTP